ncbi:MAG: FtsW/RodA/SpoVE family cell cycle protein, partial [Acutalibacteraceae bacterium]
MTQRDYARPNDRRNPYNDPRDARKRQRDAERSAKEEEKSRKRLESVKAAEKKGESFGRFLNRWTLRGTIDAPFVILVFILLCIGLVMMFSAGYTDAYYRKDGDALWYIKHQIVFAVIGVAAMFLVSFFNYKRLNGALAVIGYAGSALLLMITFVVNLHKDSDFKRWLKIGPINFQPSELAKFAVILFLAYNISRQYGMIGSKKVPDSPLLHDIDDKFTSKIRVFYKNASTMSMVLTLWYTLIISFICALIIIENHISCTILIFMIGVGMMWLGGVKKGYFVVLAAIVAAAVFIVVKRPDILPGYAGERIIAWTDKTYKPLGARWQTNQSLRAIASGGPFGLGLGNSRQKH